MHSPISPALADVLPLYRRFTAFRRPDRPRIAAVVLVVFVMAATNTALIWTVGRLFDLIGSGRYETLLTFLAGVCALAAINQFAHFLCTLGANGLGLRFVGRVRTALLRHLLGLAFPHAARYSKGDLLMRLGEDINRLQQFLVEMPLFCASHVVILLFYVAMLLGIDWRLALLALAMTPLFALHQRLFATPKRRAAQGFLRHHGLLVGFEDEAIANMRHVNSYGAENHAATQHHDLYEKARYWAMKERWLDASFSASFSFLIYFCGLLLLYFGIANVVAGDVTLGELVSFLLYLGYMSVPVRGLAHLPFQAQAHAASAERIAELLQAHGDVTEASDAKNLSASAGEIRFEDVGFGYPASATLYHNLTLHLRGGETVALVGPSGAGKTTFALLLMRFYDPQRGRILIDGEDIRALSIASLRRHIAVVWQQPMIFSATLRANLLLARAEASERELIEACRQAGAWQFIEHLPEQLETRVGAGGMELSAGQKQRLAIAQAFLADTPILILDEASSALDSASEQVFVEALERLRRGRTTLIIAHRYSSIRSADRIVYFNGDGSVAIGRHEDLLRRHPGYLAAVQWQVQSLS